MTDNWENERPAPGAAPSWKVEYPEALGSFLKDPVHDDLMRLIMELAAETWVVKRRLHALESQLADSGAIVPLDLEITNDEARNAAIDERDAFIRGIFGHLLAEPAPQADPQR